MTLPRQVWAFDCEWAPDVNAGRRLYHLPPSVPDDEVMRVMWREAGATEEDPQPFLRTLFCRVVSIATVVRVMDENGVRLCLWTLPEAPEDAAVTEADILGRYLGKFGQVHAADAASPFLVGFNSRNADSHILAQRAIVNGLSLPGFASQIFGKPWEMNGLDLMEIVGGRAKNYNCALNEIAQLCGIPGKLDTTGNDVAGLFYGGKRREIVEYNAFDALTTYLVWLRVEYFRGTFTANEYAAEQALVRKLILAERAKPNGAYLGRFLTAWEALA